MSRILTFLLVIIVNHVSADDRILINNAYLNGTWNCSSQTVYPGDMVVEVIGRVEHVQATGRYAYSGHMVSFFKHDPNTTSILSIEKSGTYTLEANHLENATDDVQLTPGKDGLGIHSDDFMMMMSNGLRQPVVAELTVIDANTFKSVVVGSVDTERCTRSKDDKLSD